MQEGYCSVRLLTRSQVSLHHICPRPISNKEELLYSIIQIYAKFILILHHYPTFVIAYLRWLS